MNEDNCATCGGRIQRLLNIAYHRSNQPPDRPWVHIHDKDWIDNPHQATPKRHPR